LNRYELFGGIPRSIFKKFSIKMEKALRMHCDVVAKFLSSSDAGIRRAEQISNLSQVEINSDLSFAVLTVMPIDPTNPDDATFSMASVKIQEWVEECLRESLQNKYEHFIVHACINSKLSTLRGVFLESYVHQLFHQGGTFKVRQLKSSHLPNEAEEINLPRLKGVRVFNKVDECFAEESKGFYCKPHVPNFPSMDAFISPNICVQVTVANYHPIKWSLVLEQFFNRIQGVVKFYFVTVPDVFDQFDIQSLKSGLMFDRAAGRSRSLEWPQEHADRVQQNVLCMIDSPGRETSCSS